MENLLLARSRQLCLGLALLISAIFIIHGMRSPLSPIADGAGYATRAFALYGFLHTGQLGNFFDLLCHPHQSICTPCQLLFFLMPKFLAGTRCYYFLQILTANLLLAWAMIELTETLARPQWGPPVFLLCAVNNVALTDFYAFYVDMTFFALGLWVIARQVQAWQLHTRAASLVAGAGLASLFIVKPANALVFLGTYFLSEFFRAAIVLVTERHDSAPVRALRGHWLFTLLGFVPVFLVAWLLGAAQSILLLIDWNEVQQTAEPVACGGLLRLLYFPLCFSACYHALILGALLLFAFVAGRWLTNQQDKTPPAFPPGLLLPLVLAYLVLGLFFSFWMIDRPMRSLLLMLPIGWFLVALGWEKSRGRIALLFAAAIVYAFLAFSQKAFDVFKSKGQLLEDTYQLTASSWSEFPAAWRKGLSLNQYICELVSAKMPPRQIICINSIELRDSLSWRLQHQDLLDGKPPAYQVRNLFDYQGNYFPQSLAGADRVVLITFFPAPPLKNIWLETSEFMDYASLKWNRPGVGRMLMFPRLENQPIGYDIWLDHPLAATEIDQANRTDFGNLPRAKGDGIEPLYGHHYSAAETRALIGKWRKIREE